MCTVTWRMRATGPLLALTACTVPVAPCVPGFAAGTYQVQLLERYIEDFVTSVYLASGSDPFAHPVAGQRPPVLMGLLRSGAGAACSGCTEFWVVTLTRASGS